MKILHKLSALLTIVVLAGVSFASAQSQDSLTRTYTLPDFTVEGVTSPVLESYSTPQVPSSKIGLEITMHYTINKEGKVQSIRSNAGPFSDVASADLAIIMTQTLRNWKFEPAINGAGEPVAIKVSMPVKVTVPGSEPNAYAGIEVKSMKLVAKTS